jgi:hypothetical protein
MVIMETMTLLLLCSPLVFFFLLQIIFSLAIWRTSGFDSPVYIEEPKPIRRHGGTYLDSSRPRYRKGPTY